MRFNDSVFGIAFIVLAIAEIAYTQTFPQLHGQNYGPNLFPIIIGVGFLICGVTLVARGYSQRASIPIIAFDDWVKNRDNVINLVLLLAGVVLYILVSPWLGFIPTSVLILMVLLMRLGTGFPAATTIALVTTLIIHTLFARVLLVPLPWGILQGFSW